MSPTEHNQSTPDSSPERRLSHAESARTLPLLASRGVLSTLDAADGYPYGSLAEFVSTDEGDLVFLLSDLAAHTTNFKADARASLFVSQEMVSQGTAGTDSHRPLALERVTLLGDIELAASPDQEGQADLRQAYLDRHPHAATYVDFSDFSFWRLHVRRVRYIGGFGRMSWVDQDAYRNARPDPIAPLAAGAIEHMNHDHTEALLDYVRAFGDVDDVSEAIMIALDRFGFDVQARDENGQHKLVRVHFDEPLGAPSEVRGAMVEMVKKARARLG